jgi:sulfite reductase (ferredoxin)
VRTQMRDITDDPEQIVTEFKKRFYDTQLFQSPDAGQYAGGKFALYLLNRHADKNPELSLDRVRHLVEEAQLFIEAAYSCHHRITEQRARAMAAFNLPAAAEATV